MPLLTLTRLNGTYTHCLITDDDGANPVYDAQFKPLDPKKQKEIAKQAGMAVTDLLRFLGQLRNAPPVERGQPKPTVSVPIAGPKANPGHDGFTFRIRGLNQPTYAATLVETDAPAAKLTELLQDKSLTIDQPLIEWDGTDVVACLDVDYHYADAGMIPPASWRTYHAGATRPTPFADHLSHGGGVKLYYVEKDGFRADELAAVASIYWASIDARCRCEVLSRTRHPLYPRPDTGKPACEGVGMRTPSTDVGELQRWFSKTVTEAAVDEWLAEQGYRRGDALEHSHCPISPGYVSKGKPVLIGDFGIFCQSCSAYGKSRGGRKPGFVGYAQLIGTVNPAIQHTVKHLAHWEHARIVMLDRLKMPERLLKLAYSAMLKVLHGTDDPRIPSVFRAGRDMVRQLRRWTTVDGSYTYPRDIGPMLSELPACQVVAGTDESRSAKPVTALVTRFAHGSDLTEYGYPAVTPLPGCRIYGHYLDYTDDKIRYPVPHRQFTLGDGRFAPQYLKPDKRHKEPWKVVEQFFPGINREYVKLLIVQKGFVEGQQAQAPFVLVSGPTGAGKSTMIHVAASICGDYCTDLTWCEDSTRLRQQMLAANDAGSFMTINEVFKEANRAGVSYVAALDPILNLTEDSTSHKMYVGPVALDRLPALVCTDVTVPYDVFADKQLARRFIYVHLSSQQQWDVSILKTGLGQAKLLRCHNEETAWACNSILSDVIDEFFRESMLWSDAARKLGFALLNKSDDYESPDDELREFFRLVCEAPDSDRKPGPGWKLIRQEATGALVESWGRLADGKGDGDWGRSRRCSEVDWQKLLGGDRVIEIDISRYSQGITLVRFRVGTSRKPDAVNAEIFPTKRQG